MNELVNDLAVLGESVRRDLEDWLYAQCARWLPDDELHIGGLEAAQAIASDTAALLSACYQVVALDAWLTAGFMPADRAEFDEQVTAMALADSGVEAAVHGPGAVTEAAPVVSRAWPDPDIAAIAPRRPDTMVGSDPRTVSDLGTAPEAPLHAVIPARGHPAAAPVTEDEPPRSDAGSAAGTRPAASGFQRLKGLQELAARAQSVDRAEPSREAAPRIAAPPRALQKEATTAAPGPTRTIRSPVHVAHSPAPDGWPGAEPDERWTLESPGPAMRARGDVWPSESGDRLGERADARASMGVEDLQASFRPLRERPASPADASPLAGPSGSRPAQRSRPEPAAAAIRPGPAVGRSMVSAEPAESAPGGELATPSARAAQLVRGSESTRDAALLADELLPSDIESVLDAITEDLERDFSRLYGGG